MQRKDFYALGILYLLLLLIFYPLFTTDYIFTDEAWLIWGFKPDTHYVMYLDDGRALTEWMLYPLFTRVHTIHAITYVRIISLVGWMICLPIWYYIIKKATTDVPYYEYLPGFSCLYLITSLPFMVSVQWTACAQFFIAQTSAVVAGAVFCSAIRFKENKMRLRLVAIAVSLVLGVTSMLFYQSASGCYLIPFLLYFINSKKEHKNKVLITGVAGYALIYLAYFAVYKALMNAYNVPFHPRNVIHIDVIDKIKWFLAQPLERSFHFSVLIREENLLSKLYYASILLGWVLLAFKRFGKGQRLQAVYYLGACSGLFILSYLPNMIIAENYASNRTVFALNLCVWFVCAEMFLYFVRNKLALQIAGGIIVVVFVIAARNNFRNKFLQPAHQETMAIKNYVDQHYNSGIRTIYFIRPHLDFIAKKFNISGSMDEFAQPVSHAAWVPEPLCRQLVYEKTGNRQVARQLAVQQWPDQASFTSSGATIDSSVLFIDVEAIMNAKKP